MLGPEQRQGGQPSSRLAGLPCQSSAGSHQASKSCYQPTGCTPAYVLTLRGRAGGQGPNRSLRCQQRAARLTKAQDPAARHHAASQMDGGDGGQRPPCTATSQAIQRRRHGLAARPWPVSPQKVRGLLCRAGDSRAASSTAGRDGNDTPRTRWPGRLSGWPLQGGPSSDRAVLGAKVLFRAGPVLKQTRSGTSSATNLQTTNNTWPSAH